MTVQARTEELMKAGAAITVHPHGWGFGGLTVPLAAVLWEDKRLRWCAPYPEHQGHVHRTPYTTAKLEAGGRDVALYDARGEIAAYITPLEESELDARDATDALTGWRAVRDEEVFQRFFEQA